MTTKPNPQKPGWYDIDCRPWGYKGKRVRETIKADSLEAAEKWEDFLMRREDRPGAQKIRTCSTIFASYKKWYKVNRAASSYKDLCSVWRNHLQPVFGKKAPKLISKPFIEQYKAKRIGEKKRGEGHLATVSPRTVNKELNLLSGMITWAADQGLCDELGFKIKRFDRKMVRPPKPQPLSPDQVTKAWQAIEPEYKLIFLLMADAGLRRTEAYRLKRRQIHFERNVISVIGKGSKERLVPIMTPRLRAELEKRKSLEPDAYLSVNPSTKKPYHDIKKALVRAAKAAGVEQRVYNHLLRHSFGTNATVAGVDPNAVQEMMGHEDLSTTQIYQHLAVDYLQGQAGKFAALVDDSESAETYGHMDKNEVRGKSGGVVHMDKFKIRRKAGGVGR